jgi:hypothetical protein
MRVDGKSKFAQGWTRIPPFAAHVAIAVPDIQEAKAELERIVSMMELHQDGYDPQSPARLRHASSGSLANFGRGRLPHG